MTDDIPMKTLIQETLDCMAIHEKTVEYADCILWDAATGDSLVRRDVFRLSGNDLKPRVPIDTKCGEKCCLNPKHLFESTTSAVAIRAGQRGAFSSLSRRAKIAASRRGKMKLNIEQAREIRMSDETGPVLAVKYGVNKSLINNIKRNRAWRDYSNPFAGLMA
jgi:hypothetical protein